MSSQRKTTGAASIVRRTWDRNEYEQKAQERIVNEINPDRTPSIKLAMGASKAYLTHRDAPLNLEAELNKSRIVSSADRKPGFYCELCDIVLQNSDAYLSHLNGKMHQSKLGNSLRVERVGVDRVRAKLAALKRERETPKPEYDFEARVREAEENAKRIKDERKERKQEAKRQKIESKLQEETVSVEPEIEEAMKAAGFDFSSFGSSK